VDRTNGVITHECGTKICRENGIEYARRLFGHANISTTQRYVHLDDRVLADAQDLVEQVRGWESFRQPGAHASGFCTGRPVDTKTLRF